MGFIEAVIQLVKVVVYTRGTSIYGRCLCSLINGNSGVSFLWFQSIKLSMLTKPVHYLNLTLEEQLTSVYVTMATRRADVSCDTNNPMTA